MTIAIVGTGSVGSALGTAFGAAGHEIVYGSREPGRDSVRDLVRRTASASAAAPEEAVREADVVVLATPWTATEDIVRGLDLAGRVVLDATNPITWPDLRLTADPSGAETVQAWAPDARVVKAFNAIGANITADAAFEGDARPALLIAGDDAEAKGVAAALAESIGFEGVDAGPLARSRELEHLAVLWIGLASGPAGREIALALLRR